MYPIILALRAKRALVVGGGPVAERKVRGLLDAEADVVVVAPNVTDGLAALAAAAQLRWEQRPFAAGDAVGATVVFAATDRDEVNAAVVADARAAGALVNDTTDPARSDFATPAIHRAGPITVTVDSAGLSPSFTKRVRDELAVALDTRYARAAESLGRLRTRVLAVVPPEGRAAVMRHLSDRDLDDLAAMPPQDVEHEVERAADSVLGVVPAAPPTLVCASRASALAMVQTRAMMARLAQAGIASTVLNITTRGDAVQDRSLAAVGGDSLFVKELELALRDRRADYAVHSCKDLPSTLPDDMTIAAITVREDPRDAFCSERYTSFAELPAGARVGTSSPRRRAQLQSLRPDLTFLDIRGNIDTRLRKLRDGEYDAIVLACAGIARLGVRATHLVPFDPADMTPAVGQGALAIETRAGDALATHIAAALGDPVTDLCVRAERAYLRTLRGGCQAPVGAHATFDGTTFRLLGVIAALDGSRVVRGSRTATLATGLPRDHVCAMEALAVDLAHELLGVGGAAILSAVPPPHEPQAAGETAADDAAVVPAMNASPLAAGALHGFAFLLPRTQDRPSRIAPALRDAGADVVEAADAVAARAAFAGGPPTAILFPSSGSVLAMREYLDELRAGGHRPLIVAMGPASAAAAGDHGFTPDIVSPNAEIAAFVHTVTRYVLEHA